MRIEIISTLGLIDWSRGLSVTFYNDSIDGLHQLSNSRGFQSVRRGALDRCNGSQRAPWQSRRRKKKLKLHLPNHIILGLSTDF